MNYIHEKIDLGYETLQREDGEKRRYVTPEGVAYPSVTTVTSILNEDKIAKWRAKVGEEEANKIYKEASDFVHSKHRPWMYDDTFAEYLALVHELSSKRWDELYGK